MRTTLSALAIIALLLLPQTILANSTTNATTNFTTEFPYAEVLHNSVTNTPSYLGNLNIPVKSGVSHTKAANNFLMSKANLFKFDTSSFSLKHDQTLALGTGKIVKFSHNYKSIPVLNGQTSVFFNVDGQINKVFNTSIAIKDLDTTPTISSREAIVEAWAKIYGTSTDDLTERELSSRFTALYIINIGNVAHLAYAVGMPFPLITEKRLAFIDAHSGNLLRSYNLVKNANTVNVYEYNPGSNQDAETVERELLSITPDQKYCESDLVETFNCPDEGGTVTINFGINVTVPMCSEKHIAELDNEGNMNYEPVLKGWGDASSHADPFSEVHLFYHVQQIYDRFQNIALHINSSEPPFVTLDQVPFHSVANFSIPDISKIFSGASDVGLIPFDNAFFVPAYGLIPGEYPEEDSIIFGQGSERDFAYDADVIYHEFTHAVIGSTINLGSIILDQYGLTADPGAMNEGYADYFSATYVGDPQMAEFVGGAFESTGGDSLRNLENTKKCPDDVIGEVHSDSEWWSASLWKIREQYKVSDEDHDDVDAAIFEALLQLPQEASYTLAANTTANVLGEWFGADAKTFATQTFTEKGLINCNRAVPIESGFKQSSAQLYGKDSINLKPFVPGLMQYHASLEQPIKSIVVTFRSYSGGMMGGGATNMDVDMLVKKGDAIVFNYTAAGLSSDEDFSVPFIKTATDSQTESYEAIITPEEAGELEAGEWYFIMVNNGNGGGQGSAATLMGVTFEYGCMTDEDCEACNYCNDKGVCSPFETECQSDEDCVGLDVCVVDECTATCQRPEDACATGMDCGDCQTCTDNRCVDIASECAADEDCEEGETCMMDKSNCSGTCEPIEEDGDSVEDGDLVEDGDTNDGSGATGSGGGCNQSNSTNIVIIALMLSLVLFRRRQRS